MRRTLAVAALTLTAALAACSSSGGSSPKTSSAPAGTGTSSSTASEGPAAGVAARMRAGLAGLRSAHIVVDAGTLGGTSEGDFAYSGGQSTGSDIVLDSGADKTEIITVGSTSYAKLPAGRNTSGKPWVKVSSTSSNEFVRALASSIDISKAASSLPAVADVTATATAVQDKGTDSTGHHYALTVEPSKAGSGTLATLLAGLGQQSVPVDLYLDPKGRPVKIVIGAKLGTQTFHVTVVISKFDAPVHITAPPQDQVFSG